MVFLLDIVTIFLKSYIIKNENETKREIIMKSCHGFVKQFFVTFVLQ